MKKLHGKSVLIVDDDPGMLRSLDKVLTGEGAVVTRAEWAGDAMVMLNGRQKRIDLVITDLRMPFITGMTVVYGINKIFPGLPVIVLTAFGSPDVKGECLRQGAAAFLEKPLDTEQLLDAIEDVFASRNTNYESSKSSRHRKERFANENAESDTPN
jgi:two-component system response regulator GlrR